MSDILPQRIPRRRNRASTPYHDGTGIHFTRFPPHMCMCLDACCNAEHRGCICRHCPCNNGGPDHEIARVMREESQKREHQG